jgi:hypothetical protein
MEADARRTAAQSRKRGEDTLDVLVVDLKDFDINVPHAVDLKLKKLVKKAG